MKLSRIIDAVNVSVVSAVVRDTFATVVGVAETETVLLSARRS